MNAVLEGFSDFTAPPGHVTFSVLDHELNGHSVSIASKEYPGIARVAETGSSGVGKATALKGAIDTIRRGVACTGDRCQRDDDSLLYAFISALLNHPDKLIRKALLARISGSLRNSGGAHVILIVPPVGPSAWLIADPSDNGPVH